MPTYEYRCDGCGHGLEADQAITADPLRTCPACGDEALQRLISRTSFVLKGSGWYATDYQDKGPTAKSSGDEAGGDGAEPAADTKADAGASTSADAGGSTSEPASRSETSSAPAKADTGKADTA